MEEREAMVEAKRHTNSLEGCVDLCLYLDLLGAHLRPSGGCSILAVIHASFHIHEMSADGLPWETVILSRI